MADLQREVWEGWTVRDFIESLAEEINMIMTGNSFVEPFITKTEMINYIKDNQPYYKKSIPEVNEYFVNKYYLN